MSKPREIALCLLAIVVGTIGAFIFLAVLIACCLFDLVRQLAPRRVRDAAYIP